MKAIVIFILCMMLQQNSVSFGKETHIEFAQALLLETKKGNNTDQIQKKLASIQMEELIKLLDDDANKKSFWINIYNAYTQIELKKNPERYKKRSKFFKSKFIVIAGENFSLDDIEHGILRRSKSKISMGYFNSCFPGQLERKLRVSEVDPRLHFALNCGAKSCPPIAFYAPEHIEKQLDLSTKSYLTNEIDIEDNRLHVPKLFSWFRGDFGGKKGIKKFIHKYLNLDESKKYKLKFKDYSWELELGRYNL